MARADCRDADAAKVGLEPISTDAAYRMNGCL